MPGYEPVPISDADVAKLWDEAQYPVGLSERLGGLLIGDKNHWPCPRCADGEAREAQCIRRMVITVDRDTGVIREAKDEETDGLTAEVKRARGLLSFFGDLTGGLIGAGVDKVMDRLLDPITLVYNCSRHGEFHIAGSLGEIHWQKVFVLREGQLMEVRPRYSPCTGFIETVSAEGERTALEHCHHILEARGECIETGIGECLYSCPLHGTQAYGADGTYRGVQHRLVRRVG